MATSELSDRLDYLISYSSQLVFVCTDKIKQQSRVVESFLNQQDEQTDVALVTADPLISLATYRETIFKQLLTPPQNVDFHRPLNQILAPLNNKDGTVLISIFQADQLPNKLVKEIWELVLQSRFANNKQHLNVLLMGESSWAEQMKSGLASRSKDKPIILKSSINSLPTAGSLDEKNFQSLEHTDLETLLQDNRQKFAERVKNRNQVTYVEKPLLKKWWMITLLTLVFLVTFAGILGWQYSDSILKWVAVNNNIEEAIPTPTNIIMAEKLTQIEVIQEPKEVNESNPLITLDMKQDVKSLLVTDWQTAIKKIENNAQQPNQSLLYTTEESQQKTKTTERETKITTKQPPISLVPPAELLTNLDASVDGPSKNTPVSIQQDYAVPDITIETQNALVTPTPETLETSNPNALAKQLSNTSNDVMALPSSHFVIQIAAMTNLDTLMNYINDENLKSDLWVVKIHRNKLDWYVLIHNQDFTSIESAKLHMKSLSPAMLKNSPFVKKVQQIQQEYTAQVH